MAQLDTTVPTINITAPLVNTIYTSTTTKDIIAAANDLESGVAKINFYVTPPNGTETLVGWTTFQARKNTLRSASVAYTFNTLGVYNIRAEAIDRYGNSSSAIITVSRANSNGSTSAYPCPPLPSSWILNTPPAFNQGGTGACVAHACALVLSTTYYYENKYITYSENTNIFSPEYIVCKNREINFNTYNCVPSDGVGMSTLSAFDIAMISGVCRWEVLPWSQYPYGCQTNTALYADVCVCSGCPPYNPINNPYPAVGCHHCLLTEFPNANIDAAAHKITKYGIAYFTDVCTIKRLLRNGRALHFAMTMDSNITYAPNDPNYVWRVRANNTIGGPHSMVIIGYDDSKQAWLCQNSWGPNWSWDGKIWMDYTLSAQNFSYGLWCTFRPDMNPFYII